MTYFKTLVLALALSIHFCEFASADAFIEPSVGYKTNTLTLTNKQSSATTVTMATPAFGLKLGYRSMMGIDINLAGDYSSGKADYSPLVEKNNFTHKIASVQLGVSAMDLMKIYLGYGFLNNLKIEAGTKNSDINLNGQSYQAGLQFKIYSSVYLGALYNLNLFKTVSGTNYTNEANVDQYFNKIDSQDLTFSLSTVF